MRNVVRSLGVSCVAALCASCVTANPAPPGQTEPARLPEIRVELDSDTVKSGQEFVVRFTLDNHGEPPHRLDFASGCQFDWTITTRDGVTFSTRCEICTMATTSILLGDDLYEASVTVPTRRVCESARFPWPFATDSLPAGWYRLTVLVIGYEQAFETHPVAFEVVE